MKKLLILLLTLIVCSDRLWAQDELAILSGRPVMSSIEVRLGSASVRNTYLAPLLYSGPDLGMAYERARRWKNPDDWMSLQSLSGQFTMGEDKGSHSESMSARIRYRYAAHYRWDLFYFMLMVGPYVGTDVGFDYNLKIAASNNPATAHVTINTGLSLMGTTHYRLFGRTSAASLLLQAPLLGYALMPEYGASYYESFYLHSDRNMHHFTSLHNQQDLDVRLVTDIPLLAKRGGDARLGVAYHIETMKINQVTTRLSSFEFIVGWTFQSVPYNSHNSLKQYVRDEAY